MLINTTLLGCKFCQFLPWFTFFLCEMTEALGSWRPVASRGYGYAGMHADIQAVTSRAESQVARHLCKAEWPLIINQKHSGVGCHCVLLLKTSLKLSDHSWVWGGLCFLTATLHDLYQCVALCHVKSCASTAPQTKLKWHWRKSRKENVENL